MSYSNKYREIITVIGSESVTVNYPASESGGSKTVTIEYSQDVPIDVNIHVDTVPFDNSVAECNNNVNLLTGAVVATEAAQVSSVDKNAKKVANTIVSGFFKLIRSDLSQQITELTLNVNAQLMHLKELAQSCLAKKKQMENDYNRISSRYLKIFDDLDSELSNRIFQLDKPAFIFKKETDNQKIRISGNDLVNTVAISGTEAGGLHSRISASIAKKRASDAINKAKMFLSQQKKLSNTIQQSMINENTANSIFSPVCFIETKDEKNQIAKNLFSPDMLASIIDKTAKNEIMEMFSKNSILWVPITKEYHNNLNMYFNSELNKSYSQTDQRSIRVKEMIQKISNINSINIINYQRI